MTDLLALQSMNMTKISTKAMARNATTKTDAAAIIQVGMLSAVRIRKGINFSSQGWLPKWHTQ